MLKIGPLIGLAGVILAAMSTELNEQVATVALPDISGALGLSHDAGTWYSTLYVSGEIVGTAISAWWAITVSLRRFTLFTIVLACLATLLIPLNHNYGWLYTFRILQGLAGGLTLPLLMTTALRVLPPAIRLYGLAAYSLTATFFPNLGTTVAALWTDVVHWHFIYYQAVPLSAFAALLVWYGMPIEAPKYERLRQYDWRGNVLVLAGFVPLTILLQQGDRLDWFHSDLICVLTLLTGIAIPLFLLNEWFHPLPLIKLQLLGRRNFAYGAIALFTFLLIGLSASEIPYSYLMEVRGYRPLQAYSNTLEIAAAQLILLPLMARVLDFKWVDSRLVSFVGLSCILTACIGDSYLDSTWNRDQFYLWQALQAVGDAMVVVPLLMMATNCVNPDEGPFASATVNTPRALADAAGVWLIQLINRWRGHLHSDRITDQLGIERFRLIQGQGSPAYAAPLLPSGMPRTPDSLRQLNGLVQQQTIVLTLSDAFLVMAGLVVALMLVLLVLPVRTYSPRIALANQ